MGTVQTQLEGAVLHLYRHVLYIDMYCTMLYLLDVIDFIVFSLQIPSDLPLSPVQLQHGVNLFGRLFYYSLLHINTGYWDPLIHTTIDCTEI